MASFDSVGPLHDGFSRALLFHYMEKPSFLRILKYQELPKDTSEGLVKKSSLHMSSHVLASEIIFLTLMILSYLSAVHCKKWIQPILFYACKMYPWLTNHHFLNLLFHMNLDQKSNFGEVYDSKCIFQRTIELWNDLGGKDLKNHFVSTLSPRAGVLLIWSDCLVLYPDLPWWLTGMGHPQHLWATCLCASPPSEYRFLPDIQLKSLSF